VDLTGFEEFVADRGHVLFRSAYALCGSQHDAEDLVQIALAKAAARWSRIEAAPEAYIRRIMYRDFVSAWRWRRRRPEVLAASPPELPEGGPGDSVVDRLVLTQALVQLPPRQRAVLVLRYLEDMSERQVAETLGCSPGTVASQASRALAKLRTSLSDDAHPTAVAPSAVSTSTGR